MTTLLIATRNRHKVGEIKAILGSSFQVLTLNDVPGAPAIVENAPDFAGNAQLKSIGLADWLTESRIPMPAGNVFVLADDSGLEVDALNGAPGVHSARFAALDLTPPGALEGNSSDAENNAKLLRLLEEIPPPQRAARFRCVIALTPVVIESREISSPVCFSDEAELRTELFEGACEGRIIAAPSGAGGFGYDPLFVPNGYEKSFAEIGEELKNGMSHRARALQKLKKRFQVD